MRGELMFNILSALDEGKDEMLDLLGAYLVSGMSYNPVRGRAAAKDFIAARKGERKNKEEERQVTRRFYAMVSYLERDGLVERRVAVTGVEVKITPQGKSKLGELQQSIEKALPSPQYKASSDQEKRVTIVTFDIPEKERRKRDWLRCALKNIGFEMIHRSVWMGNKKVPEQFLEDVRDMKLGDYLEMFEITKMGSLKRLM